MFKTALIGLAKVLLNNPAVFSFVIGQLLDLLDTLAQRSSTTFDNEVIARIRSDLVKLGYLDK